MKINSTKLLLLVFMLFLLYVPINAEIGKGDFGLSLNYPGIGIRYFAFNKLSFEAKGQFEKDISVGGLRSYLYFNPKSSILLFTGIEGDYFSFKGDDSKGAGYVGGCFIGGETFFAKNLSLQLDIGPAYIMLKDKDTKVKEEGIEYIANIAITYYIGR